ncbi:deoxycytidylate deaminase [Thermobrachium celere]|uniref:dCMP deaminase Late competence protein ComEB n=1 Tax=Thermobrachium celere DSM 8682 TaxID=941824 RepID=R7RPL6_9CLOT|nr:cytidine/deoxycytidylate deaminase family protein [Thermobrachium celere]GFR35960.1 dCMP deaminase [Thermobrachium celere]CDF57316.1 dCMP deaminase; Late competence protein ComEB [Thermobrachium celere DSM 8682]
MRPSWDEYFMEIANTVKKRSTCLRRQVGAVIVKDNRILTTGYNGVPPKMRHCLDIGCLRQELNIPSGQRHELCRALHAEQNAIIQAAKYGISIEGATIYVTAQPCIICAKQIIASGIKKIVFSGDYPDEFSLEMIKESGIEIVRFNQL